MLLKLSKVYDMWADLAEEALVQATGKPMKTKGKRGQEPRLVYKKVGAIKRYQAFCPEAAEQAKAHCIWHQLELLIAACGKGHKNQWGKVCSFPGRSGGAGALGRKCVTDVGFQGGGYRQGLGEHIPRWNLQKDPGAQEQRDDALEDAAAICAALRVLAEKACDDQKIIDKNVWRKWAQQALEGGAGQAHRNTKKFERWFPGLVEHKTKGPTSEPHAVLEFHTNAWKDIWGARTTGNYDSSVPKLPQAVPPRGFDGEPPLPPLSVDEIRRAAGSFSKASAEQIDGFRLVSISWLPDDLIEILSAMFACTDHSGILPKQVARTLMPMLSKADGGHWLIGIFACYYRLWARCRAGSAAEWEAQNDRQWLASGRGRSPLDCVWRSELCAESADGGKGCTVRRSPWIWPSTTIPSPMKYYAGELVA